MMAIGRGGVLAALFASYLLVASSSANASEPSWRSTVRDFAMLHFKHPAWGYSHSLRDYALAQQLAASDHVTLDDDVLFVAAMLHDMAGFAPWEDPKRDHEDVACETIVPVLRGAGFPMDKLAAVQSAIRSHMYYRKPKDAVARYLHDADGLDWLGAIGAARVMALADPHGGRPDAKEVEGLIERNLKEVPDTMETPSGKAMMPSRRDTLRAWLTELRRQTDNLNML